MKQKLDQENARTQRAQEQRRHDGRESKDGFVSKDSQIKRDDDAVEEASEDSFPASDPPSYTGTTAGRERR